MKYCPVCKEHHCGLKDISVSYYGFTHVEIECEKCETRFKEEVFKEVQNNKKTVFENIVNATDHLNARIDLLNERICFMENKSHVALKILLEETEDFMKQGSCVSTMGYYVFVLKIRDSLHRILTDGKKS